MKSSNILLDEVDNAYIGDLGLARSTKVAQEAGAPMVSLALKGTYGYVAPETLCHGAPAHAQPSSSYLPNLCLQPQYNLLGRQDRAT